MTEINTNDEKYDSIKLAALSRYELIKEIRSLITTIESLQNDLRVANDWESDALSWRDFCNDRDNVSKDEFTEENFTLMKSELYELRTNYDHFNKCLKENDALIESQKEEIEKIGKWNHEVWAMTEAFKKDLDEAESEIESLKAITELAVKSLEKVRDRYAGEYGGHICETEMREIAKSTLSEIEKLQK